MYGVDDVAILKPTQLARTEIGAPFKEVSPQYITPTKVSHPCFRFATQACVHTLRVRTIFRVRKVNLLSITFTGPVGFDSAALVESVSLVLTG